MFNFSSCAFNCSISARSNAAVLSTIGGALGASDGTAIEGIDLVGFLDTAGDDKLPNTASISIMSLLSPYTLVTFLIACNCVSIYFADMLSPDRLSLIFCIA